MTTDATSSISRPERAVRPERLLKDSSPAGRLQAIKGPVARKTLRPFLRVLESGTLTIIDIDGSSQQYGDVSGELHAAITILDDRAWSAVLSEGAIGLGRGYIEQWWTSPNPTLVLQLLTRNIPRLERYRRMWTATGGKLLDGVRLVLPRRSRSRNKGDIAAHYDLGNDFFKLFLDETMTYSSGVFTSADQSMAEASITKYDRLLEKVDAQPGSKILEIGTGWGGFAMRAAENFGSQVTTTTVSSEQYKEASKRAADAGLADKIDLLESDWRDLSGQYDQICSIEMIEAVEWRDYQDYFSVIRRCLKPEGMVGLQAICVPDQRWERLKNTKDFIRQFVFPGGMLPSIGSINRAVSEATDLQIFDLEDITDHYAETLRRWREQFDQKLDEIEELGLDTRFQRLWRFYLCYCEAGFLERYITVVQLVLVGPKWRRTSLSVRPT